MLCESVNGNSRLEFLSILRKIGALTALVLMPTALLLLIWIMRTTYASLLNYDSSLVNLITGRTFICRFQYPAGPIRTWYFLVTFFLAIALPYTTLARFLTHRKTLNPNTKLNCGNLRFSTQNSTLKIQN